MHKAGCESAHHDGYAIYLGASSRRIVPELQVCLEDVESLPRGIQPRRIPGSGSGFIASSFRSNTRVHSLGSPGCFQAGAGHPSQRRSDLSRLAQGDHKIAKDQPDAATLVEELLNFQVKITDEAHDTYGAWRTGTWDDLVLAVAVAAWYGERERPTRFRPASSHTLNYR